MSELLERERELAELQAMVAAATGGVGGVAVVEAVAGLGKTRLLQAVRDAARDADLRVLSARATELERDFPFALVRQLFDPALAALDAARREALFAGAAGAARALLDGGAGGAAAGAPPTAPPGQADSFAILHGLYWLTAALAERQPLLLALDDVHWADAASLDYLRFLLPRLEELPLLLVVACRPDQRRDLARIATDTVARRLTPRPLSPAGATALLAGALPQEPEPPFAAVCHELSGGNPFLLRELARTLVVEQVEPTAAEVARVRALAPERVARTVLLRLARLSAEAQRLARALVVLGEDPDGSLAAALTGLDPVLLARAADELRAAAILDGGAPLRFAHPLVRSALDGELPPGERAALDGRVVALLRERGAGAQQLAVHLVATPPRGDRATVETLLEAARLALAGGAPRSAIAYLRRALREPTPEELRATVLDALVTAGIRAPDRALYDEVTSPLLEALARDPRLLVRRAHKLSMWMLLNGRARDAAPLLERAITAARQQDDLDGAFRLEAQLSLVNERTMEEARERLAPYRALLPPDSASERLAAALASEWQVHDGTAAGAVAEARRALAHGGRIFLEQPELLAPGRPVLALLVAGELDAAARAAGHALAHARRREATPELVAALWMSGGASFCRGDLTAAVADARQALDVARLGRLRLAELPLQAVLIGVLVARGELEAAAAELTESGMTGEIPEVIWLAMTLWARGLLRLEQGRAAEAVEDLAKVERLSVRWGVLGMPAPPVGICLTRALAAAGDVERARPVAERELARARRFGAPPLLAEALRAQAAVVGGAGDGAGRGSGAGAGGGVAGADGEARAGGGEATRLALLEEAARVVADSPALLVRAATLLDLGAALRRSRRRADARAPLREALELSRRCGAAGLARRAFDELAATGERVRRHTPIGVESLTPSERRVAELAAAGLTNREIAQARFLTVKTIETHLAAAYDKLGIRSRRELPAVLGADGAERR